MKLLVATRSDGKMREIRQILGEVPGLDLVALDDLGLAPSPEEEALEPHETFEENALSKARYFCRRTGLPTVADDSGLEVDALGGAPGVRTKRFAPGEHLEGLERDHANNRYLVDRLEGVEPERRTARYVCVVALVEPGRDPLLFRGEAPGLVVDEPRGSGGFGYDPHIFDRGFGGTFAEMTPAEKNARSHRGKAFRSLAQALGERGA
jgi:XTP/dITP diphosphohydrolase